MARPQRIILVRHGQSHANVDRTLHGAVPDHRIPLTDEGARQAREAGGRIFADLHRPAAGGGVMFYVSPYLRTRMTYDGIAAALRELGAVEWRKYEDPRLREQEFGNYRPPGAYEDIELERDTFGAFFYRVPGGESGADVFDRVSGAMDSMHREFLKPEFPDNMVVVSHGLTIRLFLMRWFHWTYEQFEALRNPHNCQHYVLDKTAGGKYQLVTEMSRYTEAETRVYLSRKKRGGADLGKSS